jgi:hypothetical protein
MEKNTISVRAHLISGGVNEMLHEVKPDAAIEEYLCPDMRPPVRCIVINAVTEDNKNVTLTIFQNRISVIIE